MIKKAMISAANNKESLLPQNKKKNNVADQETAAKKLFGSMLQSMQGQENVSGGASSANESDTKGRQRTAKERTHTKEQEKSDLIRKLNGESAAITAEVASAAPEWSEEGNRAKAAAGDKQLLIAKPNGLEGEGGHKNDEGQRLAHGQAGERTTSDNSKQTLVEQATESGSQQAERGEPDNLPESEQRVIAANSNLDAAVKAVSETEKVTALTQPKSAEGKNNKEPTGHISKAIKAEAAASDPSNSQKEIELKDIAPGQSSSGEKAGEAAIRSQSLLLKLNGGDIELEHKLTEKGGLKQRIEGMMRTRGSVSPQNKQSTEDTNESRIKTTKDSKKVLQKILTNGKATTPLEKSTGAPALQLGQVQKKEEQKRMPSFARREQRGELSEGTRSDAKNTTTTANKLNPVASLSLGRAPNYTNEETEITFDKDKTVWKDHTVESPDTQQGKGAEQYSSARMKLGQASISNLSVRRKIMPGLTKSVQQAAAKAKKASQTWQKHNFVLEDGKKIHLSARQVKDVLQLKLGTLNGDLNRLLQQHQQQIKEHLKQECATEIDLQFDSNQEQEMSGFFDEHSSSSGRRQQGHSQFGDEKVVPQQVSQVLMKSVRDFGYNQMEWTA